MSGALNHIPVVAIGLPVYNGQRFLSTAIDALLAQSYRDFVLIISDNASTDRTSEICHEYVQKDSRVRYSRNPRNIGLSGNFNHVFGLSSSKYFKWATSDDYVDQNMLADAVAVLDADPSIALCYPKTKLVDESGEVTEVYEDRLSLMQDDPAERFLTLLHVIRLSHQHQGLFRSDVIRRTAMLGDHVGSDINFLAELTFYGKFFEIPRYQFFRRFHADSSSWNRRDAAHQIRLYHAAGVRGSRFNTWKTHLAFVRAIMRSPCAPRRKARLISEIMRRMYWNKAVLCAEFLRDTFPSGTTRNGA
jgi:glycosyltransferase involved in cell wall biosynthesis